MEHPTKKNIDGLISYLRSLDINQLRNVKDRQHDLVLFTFDSLDSKQLESNEYVKQILLDDAYLSWILFLRFGLDKSLGGEIDYDTFLKNLSCIRHLWYSTIVREKFENAGKTFLVFSSEDIEEAFSTSILLKPRQLIPEDSLLMSSMVIALEYENILETLARQNL